GYEVTEHVITGTPASSPTAPSPTRQITPSGVYDLPLAAVRVEPGASAITGDKVTPLHWWLGNDGQIRCTSSTRPPHSAGLVIWEDGRLLVSTGGQWRTVSEETDWVSGTPASGWSANLLQVRRTGRLVESRIQVTRTGGDLHPDADVQIGTIPAGYRPTGLLWVLGLSDGDRLARVRIEADGRLTLINHGGIKRGHTLNLQAAGWRAAERGTSDDLPARRRPGGLRGGGRPRRDRSAFRPRREATGLDRSARRRADHRPHRYRRPADHRGGRQRRHRRLAARRNSTISGTVP